MQSWKGIRQRGAAGQQYAIVIGLIAVLAISAVAVLGRNAAVLMTRTANTLQDAGNGLIVGGVSAPAAPPGPADTTPDAITFTDQTGVATNTLITSNSLTPSGYDSPVSVSITGSGSPSFSINGGSFGTSGTISPGQTLQLRLTSGASAFATNTATVTVGGTVATVWSVTTLGGAVVFNYTGSNQSWTVPGGCTNIEIKAWGGGGAGGGGGGGSRGGGGGFAQRVVAVTPGNSLLIVVGGGGTAVNDGSGSAPAAYGGGGIGRPRSGYCSAGSGGGYSGVTNSTTATILAIAGGGGGGGTCGQTRGGGGGGTTGNVAYDRNDNPSAGVGTQSAGGAGATGGGAGGAGSSLQGGNGGTGNQGGGGGGGGGYYGGGGGASCGGGGSGGSGYAPGGTLTAAPADQSNSSYVAANTSDPDYVAGRGAGGADGGSGSCPTTNSGGNGLVVLRCQ